MLSTLFLRWIWFKYCIGYACLQGFDFFKKRSILYIVWHPFQWYLDYYSWVSLIKENMDTVYWDSSPSLTTIRYWFHEFKRGRTSVSEIEVTTEEMTEKIHCIEWPTNKGPWNSWDSGHLAWTRTKYPTSTIGNEKAICKMGSAFTYSRPKMHKNVSVSGQPNGFP